MGSVWRLYRWNVFCASFRFDDLHCKEINKKDEKVNKEKNAVDLIFQQILKIERCMDFHQKTEAVNKLMRMIDTHQLHISDEIRTCIEDFANYY